MGTKQINTFSVIILFLLLASGCSGERMNVQGEKLQGSETATIAGGCFWCMETPFEDLDGVYTVVSGYSGGKEKKPTYSEVSSGKTGHRESVQITFNPEVISYAEIIDVYWKQFDPTDAGGSFFDRGNQYKSAVFYHSKKQEEIAIASKIALDSSGIFSDDIVTDIIAFESFYPAKAYHQDYYLKNPSDYKSYREGSGRDDFIEKHWGSQKQEKYSKISDEELKKRLSPIQYEVTKKEGTETAYDNEYWDNYEAGIYVCIISGTALFCSNEKYNSNTGWPSFKKPIDARNLTKPTDQSMGIDRIEVRSKYGDSHLGHIFNDGLEPTNLRYCINSAALKFIPKQEMLKEGYERYLWLLE